MRDCNHCFKMALLVAANQALHVLKFSYADVQIQGT